MGIVYVSRPKSKPKRDPLMAEKVIGRLYLAYVERKRQQNKEPLPILEWVELRKKRLLANKRRKVYK